MTYVPSLAKSLARVFTKADVQIAFKPAQKLGSILCRQNKTQPPKTELKGVYKQSCSCAPTSLYVGETRVKISTRQKQHHNDVQTHRANPESNVSGLTRHAANCTDGVIDWENPEVLATFQDKKKSALQQNLFIRESLEIRRHNAARTGLNERNDETSKYVKTTAWGPILKKF